VNPLLAELAQLDPAATTAPPAGPDGPTSGYDLDFQETVLVPSAGERVDARRERPPLFIPCQVEVQAFGELQEVLTGNSPRAQVTLVFHFQDLEQRGLVDAVTGDALLHVGDRLVAIRDRHTHAVVQAVPTPPGLYLTEAQPQSFGLGGQRNLLLAMFNDRMVGARGAG
jgi:hypothetical protein